MKTIIACVKLYSEFLNDDQQFQVGNLEGFARILIE